MTQLQPATDRSPSPSPSLRLEAWLQPLLVLFALSPFLAIAAWLLAGSAV